MSQSRESTPPDAARPPDPLKRVLAEADRHDRLAGSFLRQGQRVAAALQRGIAMGLREAAAMLGRAA